jgi:membrane associated rhomboid family serine protease
MLLSATHTYETKWSTSQMDENNDQKEGMTVQEIENIAKKYRFELVFALAFILSAIFAYFFSVEGWSIFLSAVGGIVGICLPSYIEGFAKSCLRFVDKQEQVTQLIVGAIILVVSVFLSPLIFLLLGLMGGVEIYHSVGKHEDA